MKIKIIRSVYKDGSISLKIFPDKAAARAAEAEMVKIGIDANYAYLD